LYDDTFIKISGDADQRVVRRDVVGGLAFKRMFIKQILGASLQLDELAGAS
jgi:hypothetical protein